MLSFVYEYNGLKVFCYGNEEQGYKIGIGKEVKYFSYKFLEVAEYMGDLILELSKKLGISVLDWKVKGV